MSEMILVAGPVHSIGLSSEMTETGVIVRGTITFEYGDQVLVFGFSPEDFKRISEGTALIVQSEFKEAEVLKNIKETDLSVIDDSGD